MNTSRIAPGALGVWPLPRAVLFLVAMRCAAGCQSTQPGANAKCAGSGPGDATSAEAEVRGASDRFYAALNANFTGDMAPMTAIWSHAPDVTNMNPFGGRQVGWDAVRGQFEKESKMKLAGRVVCNDPKVVASGDMGYTLCVEIGENMTSAGQPIAVNHRATNVFRRESGEWKLVHHHTDLAPKLQEAGAPAERAP